LLRLRCFHRGSRRFRYWFGLRLLRRPGLFCRDRLNLFFGHVCHCRPRIAVEFACFRPKNVPDLERDVFINRAGVCFLFGQTEFREQVEDAVRLYLKLPCQLVDSNLTHTCVYLEPTFPSPPVFNAIQIPAVLPAYFLLDRFLRRSRRTRHNATVRLRSRGLVVLNPQFSS
jgi:hypothetical protein